MKKIKLKKRKRKKYNIGIIIICLIISIIYILKIFNEKAVPLFMEYSEVEVEKLITVIVNSTVNDVVSKDSNMENLFITIKNNDGSIKSVDLNSSAINSLLYNTLNYVKTNLRYLETGEVEKINLNLDNFENYSKEKLEKGVIFEVPSGIIFNNSLLENLFPKIPIKLDIVGAIGADIDTTVTEYGINSALFRIDLNIHANVKILLPFTSKNKKIDTKIPIVVKIIEGNVPSYYFSNMN